VKGGVVGADTMGRRYVGARAADPRVRIVGVVDSAEAVAGDPAAGVAARPCTTLAELADLGIDAVFVALPNVFHAQAVLEALDRGLHVVAEAPMAVSLADATLDLVRHGGCPGV